MTIAASVTRKEATATAGVRDVLRSVAEGVVRHPLGHNESPTGGVAHPSEKVDKAALVVF